MTQAGHILCRDDDDDDDYGDDNDDADDDDNDADNDVAAWESYFMEIVP